MLILIGIFCWFNAQWKESSYSTPWCRENKWNYDNPEIACRDAELWMKETFNHAPKSKETSWDSNRKQWVEYSGTCFAKGFLPDGITFWEYLCSISLCTRWFCSISPCTRWSVSIGKIFIGNDFMIYLVLKYGIILTFLFKIFS